MDEFRTNGDFEPDREPTHPNKPVSIDQDKRLTLLERGERRIWESIDEIHRDQKATLKGIGTLVSKVDAALIEVRSTDWAKRPVWLATIAWILIAAIYAWSEMKK